MQWVLAAALVCGTVFFASCTQDGDTIYQPDPKDQAENKPLVTVIYDPNALGDRGYNDLIFEGIESAAREYGLRTMQLSPTTVKEGLTYIESLIQTVIAAEDSVRRLIVVAAGSYDDYLRKNNSRLDSVPYTDLLYLETSTPLEGKGSTLNIPYYGAMYEAGVITPLLSTDVLLVGANNKAKRITNAVEGFTEGFQSSPITGKALTEKKLVTAWLSDEVSGGFTVSDTTALQLMCSQEWNGYDHLIVPVCGGSASSFRRICEMLSTYDYVGVDCEVVSSRCNFSVVKRIDRAVYECVEQWLSPEGMPKHQTHGLADGYTEVVIHPFSKDFFNFSKDSFDKLLSDSLRQAIHEEAIRKEDGHDQ